MKRILLRFGNRYHNLLAYVGGIALLLFGLSGVLHPLMTWTGPQAETFFPPRAKITSDHLNGMRDVIKTHNLTSASMIKAIPTQAGVVMQLTENNDQARRYFNLATGVALPEHDQAYAEWLARYYTGLQEAPIKQIHFQTEFDDAYSWVNRLLPVYRIDFDTPDQRSAFVYTELGALASLTNSWKIKVQTVFSWLHTWSWLDNVEFARVILMSALLVCLLGMVLTGTAMVFLMKSRKIRDTKRRVHRYIAYLIWLPLLGFSASGFYHLLQSSFGENNRGLVIASPSKIQADQIASEFTWPEELANKDYSAISLVNYSDEKSFFRLGIPRGNTHDHVSREKRFHGMTTEQPAIYLDARSGVISEMTDRDLAIHYAKEKFRLTDDHITRVSPVMHFGPEYDFRNKRLPAWRIDVDRDEHQLIFIDPATGAVIDRITDPERYETYSFSFLHKWNFLGHLIGRGYRDALIVFVILCGIFASILGFVMLFKRRKQQ